MRKTAWTMTILLFGFLLGAAPAPESAEQGSTVEGVWKLEQIVTSGEALETQGGFIFEAGYYSTTVNFSRQGTQTNISQFGTYAFADGQLSLVPLVHVSTRAQTVVYDPEPPFSLDITIIGDEMRGVANKDGTTFVFRRLN